MSWPDKWYNVCFSALLVLLFFVLVCTYLRLSSYPHISSEVGRLELFYRLMCLKRNNFEFDNKYICIFSLSSSDFHKKSTDFLVKYFTGFLLIFKSPSIKLQIVWAKSPLVAKKQAMPCLRAKTFEDNWCPFHGLLSTFAQTKIPTKMDSKNPNSRAFKGFCSNYPKFQKYLKQYNHIIQQTKKTPLGVLKKWCRWPESNRHVVAHTRFWV